MFLRDQTIDLQQLLQFSRRFGELMQLPYIQPLADYPEIIRVLKQADEVGMGVFGGDWHSDFSFLPAPPSASILYAEEVPAVGGDTLWIDMGQALQSLASLYRHCSRPEFSCRFKWRPGSIALWDNRSTLHYAVNDINPATK